MENIGKNIIDFPELEAILERWLLLLQFTEENWKGDVPWRYNERATLSIFSGAIWKNDGFVLEEYSTEKHTNNQEKEPFYFGRCDAWFEYNKIEYDVEAKYSLYHILDNQNLHTFISDNLNMSILDVKRVKQYNNERNRLALLFLIPVIDISNTKNASILEDENAIACSLKDWLKNIKSYNATTAWYLRKDLGGCTFSDSTRKNYFYPGIALILSKIKKTILKANDVIKYGTIYRR